MGKFFRQNLPFQNDTYLVSKKYIFFRYLFLLITGAIYGWSFNLSSLFFLGWIGIVPLYLINRRAKFLEAFFGGVIWGYGWAVVSFFWLGKIESFIPFTLSLILALFPALWSVAILPLSNSLLVPNNVILEGYSSTKKYLIENKKHIGKFLLVVSLSAWWCILEWIRSWIFTGFPWNFLAATQWQELSVIQLASFTGIYGVSFILIFFNLAIAESVLVVFQSLKYKISLYRPIVFYIAIFLAVCNLFLGFYLVRKNSPDKDHLVHLKALLIQGDIPQVRFYSEEQAQNALDVYTKLSYEMLPLKPDVLIWPESAVPQPFNGDDYLCSEYRNYVRYLIDKYHVPMLLGTIDYGKISLSGDYDVYNSALYLNREGKVIDSYNKIHLVPWGEYTPLENVFPFKYFYPWIKKTFGMGRDLSAGKRNTIFELKKDIYAGVLICFEDAFPYVGREHVLKGANLLITITNDAWFPNSYEMAQHLAQAVFRCVENRRVMIRSGNNSGTCVIEPNGMISDAIFSKMNGKKRILLPDKQGRGAVLFYVGITPFPGLTFYTQYGNIFIDILLLFFISIIIFSFWKWKERKIILYKIVASDEL